MRARLHLLLAVVAASPAWAADQNLITGVDVKDAGAEVVLSVHCSKKPSFTTFSMADPPRFVIDFSESKFQGVPAEVAGGGGVVQSIKNLSYGTDASAIARVMVAFSAEVDPPAVDEAADGLVIRIAKPGGAAVASAEPVPAPKAGADAQAKADAAAAVQLKAEAEAKAQADAAARAKADADAKAQADEVAQVEAKAKADADAARTKADADAKAQADADAARAKADADAKAQANATAARAKADADAKAQADAAALAKARADADAKAQADAAARAKADAKAQADAAAQAKARADADAKAQADAARARADADAKAQADASAKAKVASAEMAPAPKDAEQSELDAEIAAAKAEAKSAAAADPAKVSNRTERIAPSSPMAQIREVGFRQLPDASRIYVRTSAAPQFSVQVVDDRTIRIEVENARAIHRNDLRFLDTSFFSSAVELITPSRQGTSYVLTVKLRQRVPYEQKVEGDMLAIDFQRPPSSGRALPVKAASGEADEESAPAEEKAE